MNFLVWNCRGAVKKRLKGILSSFVTKNNIDLVVLLEPRVSGAKALKIIRVLGFSNYCIEEARGFSGGIWLLWNTPNFSVDLVNKSHQLVHVRIKRNQNDHFIFTAIYASPNGDKRKLLWEELRSFAHQNAKPWLVAGDLNEITSANEKRGGAPIDVNRCKEFGVVIEDCKLLDMGFSGSRFTWKGPKFTHLDRIFKRLDRALVNASWRAKFHEARVRVLPRIYSDHNPLLIALEADPRGWEERPFRIFPTWMDHPHFNQLMVENWKLNDDTSVNLECLVPILKTWNNNTFGNIFRRKNIILRRIEGIQRRLDFGPNYFLEKKKEELRGELEETLVQEEKLWYHKFRTEWIRDGDRNTKYYHTLAIAKRRRNKVEALRNDNGVWVKHEAELKI
ncbi:uncharacterized protein LOC133312983 [Gastrolobium bilobum]|uniref:uncharacterized protein LOC133312983 n=1 Tax=Gastrolobium bilobum TaxID=150636 RepID=UPI002AB10BD2|nr:uncharacterized protein LOC133312983 [Gastrolobium bilobum]